MNLSISDLYRRTGDVLRALESNERVTIFHRGKPNGVIYPIGGITPKMPVTSHPAFGMWKDREDLADVAQFVRGIRRG